MKIEELNTLIHQLQENEDLHHSSYLNVPLWSIIKAPFYEILFNGIGKNKIESSADKILKQTTFKNGISRLIKSKYELLTKGKFYYSNFDGIMFVNVVARKVINNKTVFNFSDIIIQSPSDIKFLLIHDDKRQNYPAELMHKPTFESSPFRFPPVIYLSKKNKEKYSNLIAPIVQIIEKALIKQGYSKEIIQLFIQSLYHKKVIKHFYNFEKEYERFSRFLNKFAPKFIYLTNSQSHSGIILAAKERNIPIIELQHGLFTPTHRVYDWPVSYRNRLNLIPDYFFVWGDYWKKIFLERENYWTEKSIISVGNLNFDSFRELFSNKKIEKNIKNNILITSNYLVSEELSKFLLDFTDKYYTQLLEQQFIFNIKLHVKETLHPNYEKLAQKYDKIIHLMEKDISFSEALSQNDYLLSTFSVTLFEAVALGKKTAAINLLGSAEIIDSIPPVGIEKIGNKDELFNYLIKYRIDNNLIDTEYLFKRNSILNINKSLKLIMLKQI